jgi:hypothetical protein
MMRTVKKLFLTSIAALPCYRDCVLSVIALLLLVMAWQGAKASKYIGWLDSTLDLKLGVIGESLDGIERKLDGIERSIDLGMIRTR